MGCENNPERSFEGAAATVGVSSKSINDKPALELEPGLLLESSCGMGLAAKL